MGVETQIRVAIVTPTFARDFRLARSLNESVLRYTPFSHYLFVDRTDMRLFEPLANERTSVVAIEDMIPDAFFKVSFLKRHWMSRVSLPVKGWLIQQIVKISSASVVGEPIIVNMDSDTLFVREVGIDTFYRDGRTRLYRLPGGVVDGMTHVRMHANIRRLLGIDQARPPLDDYIGNVISWDRRTVLDMCAHIERTTGAPWYVGFARRRMVSEYTAYGCYVDYVLADRGERFFHDVRSHCHTYWGPDPLKPTEVVSFVERIAEDDVAFSIEGYTGTDDKVVQSAIDLVSRRVARRSIVVRNRC